MCQNAGLLIGFDHATKRGLVTRANCDSWKCPECTARMRDYWILRAEIGVRQYLKDGVNVQFVTLTSHEKLRTFSQCAYVWSSAWGNLYKAIKRKNEVFEYIMIPERHKDGRMHIHALWTATLTKKWLKDNARKRGLGYMADVSSVHSTSEAASYVTKYVGKDLGQDVPPRFRRVRVSAKWADVPKPVTDMSSLDWRYVGGNGALQTVYEFCGRGGYDLIDLGTGMYFDDVDLGTIAWVGGH